jgi:hypothetical protein
MVVSVCWFVQCLVEVRGWGGFGKVIDVHGMGDDAVVNVFLSQALQ